MLTINLLPENARRAAPSNIEQFHRAPLAWIIVALMVGVPLLLWLPLQWRRYELASLTAKVRDLEPKKAAIDQLQATMQELRAKEVAFKALRQGHNLWSGRLNILSDVTPDGLWLTELSLDARGLTIQGSATARQSDPELVSITKLAQGLKADPDFSSAVKDIQIESIKQVKEGDIEVARFTVTCALAEPLQ